MKAAVVGSLLVNCMNISPASAQVGVSPLFLEAEANRGRSQGVITLTNSADRPVRVRMYAEPFTYSRDGFSHLLEDAQDLSPYLQMSPREAVIEPGSSQRIRLLGLFPPSLPDNEYRAVVFAEKLVDSTTEETEISIDARIGTTVYMRQGELSADLLGQEASLRGRFLDLVVANKGQATARSRLTWKLLQEEAEVASGEHDLKTVLAEGDRRFSLALPDTLTAGNYTLTGELAWTTLSKAHSQTFDLPVIVP